MCPFQQNRLLWDQNPHHGIVHSNYERYWEFVLFLIIVFCREMKAGHSRYHVTYIRCETITIDIIIAPTLPLVENNPVRMWFVPLVSGRTQNNWPMYHVT
mgnify:CR=1 FL=1